MRTLKLLLPLLIVTAAADGQKCAPNDLKLYNGNILTGKDLLTPQPERVTALVIRNGLIVQAGSDTSANAQCDALVAIDLHGAFVMPGFNDAHTHIASAGQQRLTVDLDNTTSLAEMQQRIKDYAAKAAPGTWIVGGGWDHTKWPSKTLPTRQDIDAVTDGHPALFTRTDGHIAVANTAALTIADITKSTVPPSGSALDHDAKGELTGIVREGPALSLVEKQIPPPTLDIRRQALTIALNDALAHGVTSVQDLSDWDDFLALQAMESAHQLHVRVSEWLPFGAPIETLKAHQAAHDKNDPMLHTGMLKGFMDGSLGSRTAALAAPYSDDPKNSGLARYDQKTLNQMTAQRTKAGFQIGFHAIGDRANTMALNAFEAATTTRQDRVGLTIQKIVPNVRVTPPIDASALRLRIEHAQVLLPTDFDRFASLHVIASMQPSHLITDMNWAADRLGPDRIKYAYAWKSFLNHGVTLTFGTDYPVESINPFRGLYSAVTRQNEAGTMTFQPQEKLTLNEALYAYTQGSAFAENAEKTKGILAPGYLADLIVLDRDITKATPQELLHTRVLRTIVGGATVYIAPSTPTTELPHHNLPDGN